MQSITFNENGGPITVTLSAGQAQTGSYEFRLWEGTSNQMVMQQQGNFLNDQDDTYQLPTPNGQNNGRLIQGVIVIALIPPNDNYSAAMTVRQDGETLGTIPISGSSNQPSVILNLYASLVCNAAGECADTTTGGTA